MEYVTEDEYTRVVKGLQERCRIVKERKKFKRDCMAGKINLNLADKLARLREFQARIDATYN